MMAGTFIEKRHFTLFYFSALTALVFLFLPGQARAVSFYAARAYEVGGFTRSVATSDFNSDGKPDLVVAPSGSDKVSVSILFGNGDGAFQPASNYSIRAYFVTAEDFNSDGKPDLAIVNEGGVTILLGNGDGTFQGEVSYGAGTNPESVTAGDFNTDGKLDLAVANRGDYIYDVGNLSVLIGNGDGTFQGAVNYAAGDGPRSVSMGDFNGDGKPDLAVASYVLPITPLQIVAVVSRSLTGEATARSDLL